MGVRSAVIYSDADRAGLPVLLADEAYRIGPAPSSRATCKGEEIVALALEHRRRRRSTPATASSPRTPSSPSRWRRGTDLHRPPPSAIALMGSKIESRRRMIEAGVPVDPGWRAGPGDVEEAEVAARRSAIRSWSRRRPAAVARACGWCRPVRARVGLSGGAFRSAASFGDDAVYLEKAIDQPRHVEIQVLGDEHGKVVSLGERECSLQRRHQKVVEEAPSSR